MKSIFTCLGVKVPQIHERKFNPLQRIAKYSEDILPRYLNGATKIILENDSFKIPSNTKLSLQPFKLDGFAIIFGPENTGNYSPPVRNECKVMILKATIGKMAETFKIFIELPGVDSNKVKITLKKTLVIVKGEKEPPYPKDFRPHQQGDECSYGSFERTFSIPDEYDTHPKSVTKVFEKGILSLEFAKFDLSVVEL